MSDTAPAPTITIGPGWSDDPEERAREAAAQQRLVSAIAALAEDLDDYELGDL